MGYWSNSIPHDGPHVYACADEPNRNTAKKEKVNMDKTSREYIFQLLLTNNRAVERAMLAIYNRQTQEEQRDSDTKVNNGIGFSGADASLGSYYARWILSGRNLSGKHLEKARSMSLKYVRQLSEIAVAKAATVNADMRPAANAVM